MDHPTLGQWKGHYSLPQAQECEDHTAAQTKAALLTGMTEERMKPKGGTPAWLLLQYTPFTETKLRKASLHMHWKQLC